MTNIYTVLLHTLAISVIALIILVVKKLLEDKLSPRWQYGVWVIVFICLLWPVQPNGFSLLPLGLWMETIKSIIEKTITSAYVEVFVPLTSQHILPIVTKMPQSITDILFVIYTLGVLGFLVYYSLSYWRLRSILKQGKQPSQATMHQIRTITEKYQLKPCKVIELDEIQSAFVCGIISPILVLPLALTDEKIILHELMHLKYKDPLQNIIWTFFRCLHWLNPLMWKVFDTIGNDMESLCDQRVLERLEGEDRREYGKTLLAMANEKYARAVGTSSLSNGGKNISKRIQAIVRFKKYPKGMALVSVCIVAVLGFPMISHQGYAYGNDLYQPNRIDELDQAMAMTRIHRPGTLAGSLDTYAKGLMLENGIYLASASPLEKQQEIYDEMVRHAEEENWVAYHIDAGKGLDYIDRNKGYEIVTLLETEKGYEGSYFFEVTSFLNDDGIGWREDEEGNIITGSVLVPFVAYEDDGWVVEEIGERKELYNMDRHDAYYGLHEDCPYEKVWAIQGQTGNVKMAVRVIYEVNNQVQNNSWFYMTSFDEQPKLNAQFNSAKYHMYAEYELSADSLQKQPKDTIGIVVGELDSFDDSLEWIELDFDSPSSGGSSNQFGWQISQMDQLYQNKIITSSGDHLFDIGNDVLKFEDDYKIQIYWDGEVVEEFIIRGEEYE